MTAPRLELVGGAARPRGGRVVGRIGAREAPAAPRAPAATGAPAAGAWGAPVLEACAVALGRGVARLLVLRRSPGGRHPAPSCAEELPTPPPAWTTRPAGARAALRVVRGAERDAEHAGARG